MNDVLSTALIVYKCFQGGGGETHRILCYQVAALQQLPATSAMKKACVK